MIITISGMPGAGKTTLAKKLAKEINFNFISIGELRKDFASKAGLTLEQLNALSKMQPEFDIFFDSFLETFCKSNENFVIDARLGWLFCKKSIKVFVTASIEELARRIRKRDGKKLGNIDYVEYVRERIREDSARLKKLYNVNIYDLTNYDIVMDTTSMKVREELEYLLKILKIKK